MLINGKFRCAGCTRELNSEFAVCSCGFDNATGANPVHCLQIGTVLADTYVLGKVLGEGGFGITYVGWDMDLEIKVAVKEFFMSGFSSRNTTVSMDVLSNVGSESELFELNREKFLNEARVLAGFMNEPGIVTVHRFFRANNTAYIAMEYIEGSTLKDYLEQRGKLSVDETLFIVNSVMNSLAKVHDKNLVHRDISPENIIISGGVGKLIDFGAARDISVGKKSLSVVLKHGYAPVEQYQTHGNQGPWTDVYALSATIYRCITGKVPAEAVDRMTGEEVIPPHIIEPGCPVAVSNIIMKGLSLKKEDRFQSVGEMKQALMEPHLYDDLRQAHTPPLTPPPRYETTGANKNAGLSNNSNLYKYIVIGCGCVIAVLIIICMALFAISKKDDTESNIAVISESETVYAEEKDSVSDAETVEDEIVTGLTPVESKPSETTEDIAKDTVSVIDYSDAEIGDIITFGSFNEPTEWIVMDRDGDKLFILSKYALTSMAYNDESEAVTWENSTIRLWLNTTYINQCFSVDERSVILTTNVVNNDNEESGVDAGNDTVDRVFLPSIDEMKKYFSSNAERMTTFTDGTTAWCWLRSPGKAENYVADNCNDGNVHMTGGEVNRTDGGLRPAMWIKDTLIR